MKWHLLLDYDRASDVPRPQGDAEPSAGALRSILAARLDRAGYQLTAFSFEESTNGWHGKVELDPEPESPLEIVALQAVCGSDPLRESCNVQRAREVERLDLKAARERMEAQLRFLREDGPELTDGERRQLIDLETFLCLTSIPAAVEQTAGFYRDRWNTLYAPNPNRRKEKNGASK